MRQIITILVLCLVQSIFGQTVKSIRVHNSTNYSWSYATNDIDSITYDDILHVQRVFVQGDCHESSLEDVDSITFSTDEAINVVLSKDYVENANTYLFSNGVVLTEKEDSVHGKIIVIDSLDVHDEIWSESKSIVLYCDSTYKPLIAKNSKFIYYFDYNNDGNLIEILACDIDGNIISTKTINSQVRKLRRVSTEGASILDGLGLASDIYTYAQAYFDPTDTNLLSAAITWLNKFLPEGIPQDIAPLATSLVDALVKNSKAGWVGAFLSYIKLIKDIGENRARYYIGDCTPYITAAVQKGKNSVILNLDISGVTSTSKDTPLYTVLYWQEVNGERTNLTFSTSPQIAKNGAQTVTINGLNGGHYGFQVIVFPSLFWGHHNMMNLYSFHSNVVYADVARLYIETIEQDYTYYSNGYVAASMKVVLDYASEQDKAILSYYKNMGVYVHTDFSKNNIDEYFSVKENDGFEFYITLDVPIEDFSFNSNHSVGKCINKATFKSYTVDGYGITIFHDERNPTITFEISNVPKATTGDSPTQTATAASIICTYENIPEDGICGVRYSWNEGSEILKLGRINGEQQISLSNLIPGTNYSYRAFIDAYNHTYIGEEMNFATLMPTAYVKETVGGSITATSAQFEYGFTNVPSGGKCFIAIKKDNEDEIERYEVPATEKDIYELSDLLPSTGYEYWAYIEYKGKTYVDLDGRKSFTTLTPNAYVSEVISGTIAVTSAQFEYGFNNVPENGTCHIALKADGDNDVKTVSVSATEKDTYKATNLLPSTKYTYWAYIEYKGKTYADLNGKKSFTTLAPIATTGESSNIKYNSAIVSCTFSNVPEGAICGVEYTWNGGSMSRSVGTTNGNVAISLTDLKSSTEYTYCAYIEVDGKTFYGEDKTFTTLAEIPDLSGTWNCTIYKEDGSVLESPTITLTSNGRATQKGSSSVPESETGSWSITSEGKVGIAFSWAGGSWSHPVYFGESWSGVVNSMSSPSSIEGTVWRGRAGLSEYGTTYKMKMTR